MPAVPIYKNAGAPSAGTDQVWTITIGGTPTSGTFKLKLDGLTTGAITWSATNNTLRDNVDAALEALGNIGTGNVTTAVGTMTAGIGTLTVTAAGALAKLPLSNFTAISSLVGTDPTVASEISTPGVKATHRGAIKGALLVNTDAGTTYQNTGTVYAPVWTPTSVNIPELNTLAAAIPTAAVANLGAYVAGTNLTAVPGTFADEAAVQTYLVTLRAEIEARLDAIDAQTALEVAKMNALLAELRTATIITP